MGLRCYEWELELRKMHLHLSESSGRLQRQAYAELRAAARYRHGTLYNQWLLGDTRNEKTLDAGLD